MKTIEAYESADGAIHRDEDAARARDDDLIGEELDGLIRHTLALDVTHPQIFKAVVRALQTPQRKALRAACAKIVRVIDHSEEADT